MPEDLNQWFNELERLAPDDRDALLSWARAGLVRKESLTHNTGPAQLAATVDPHYRVTPAVAAMSDAIEQTLNTRNGRLLLTVGPQAGKSSLVGIWTVLRALQRNPDTRILVASYSQELASQTTARTRGIIEQHGTNATDPLTGIPTPDRLGLQLADEKHAESHWRIRGHQGGVVAVGLGGTISGRSAELLIIDDPIKGMQAADSATERAKILNTYRAELLTRLAPGAPVVLIQTRWHQADLAGAILADDALRDTPAWRHLNIPAVAEPGIPDALNRPPGEWLESARGTTVDEWRSIRDSASPRVWNALYQGNPTPEEGGLFSQAWFDRYRIPAATPRARRIVSVDPAERGDRDEAGIIGAAITPDGRVEITHDRSGHMQSDQWARQAVMLAIATGAHTVLFEAYTAEQTYARIIRQAWSDLQRQATILRRHNGNIPAAADDYAHQHDAPADPHRTLAETATLTVPATTEPPFTITGHRGGRGDKTARAAGTRSAASTGRLTIVGTLPALEHQAATWQHGQSSPDRIDAMVNAYEHLQATRNRTYRAANTARRSLTPTMRP